MSAHPYTVAAEMLTYAADETEARERVGEHLAACSFADPIHVDARPGLAHEDDPAPVPLSAHAHALIAAMLGETSALDKLGAETFAEITAPDPVWAEVRSAFPLAACEGFEMSATAELEREEAERGRR